VIVGSPTWASHSTYGSRDEVSSYSENISSALLNWVANVIDSLSPSFRMFSLLQDPEHGPHDMRPMELEWDKNSPIGDENRHVVPQLSRAVHYIFFL
jgi:hypothetical protein